jgi:cytochrome c-type biogenesis protein CcmE
MGSDEPSHGVSRRASRYLFVLVAASLVLACTGGSGPVKATLAELVTKQEDYVGRRVETGGMVRRFGQEEGATRLHYVVEDKEANRVALIPNDTAGPYTGQEVVVVGSFQFSEQDGRSIRIESIKGR